MGLMLPKHVAQAHARAKVEALLQQGPPVPANGNDETFTDGKSGEHVWPIDMPVPEGIPQAQQWRVTLMPVGQRIVSKGGIILPVETLDTQDWTHMLWKVCSVGPFVYRGPAWQGFDDLALEEARSLLQPGALYLVDAKMPRRFHFLLEDGRKVLLIVVNDDQLWSHVTAEQAERLSFRGLDL